MVGGGALDKPASAMGEVTVSWVVSELGNDFSEKEVCLNDYMPAADRNNIR